MSDIEMVREEGARASLSTLARSSMSSAGAGIVMGFDDDIPAFDEHMDDMAFGGNEPPQLDFYEDDAMMMADADFQAQEPVIDEYRRPRGGRKGADEGADEEGPFEESKSDRNNRDVAAAYEDDEDQPKAPPKARGGRGKRQKVIVDGVVELSGKLIKQRMADVGPILRRRPGDLLPRLAGSAATGVFRPAVPPSVQGLCPELQALFLMTMIPSSKRLPFPLKPGATGLSAGATASRQSSSSVKARASLDVEAVRDNDASLHDLDSRRWSSASAGAADEAAMEGFGAGNRMSTLGEPQDHDFGGGRDMYDGGYDPMMMGAEEVEQFHAGVDDYANADVYQDDLEGGGGTGGALFGCLGKRPTDLEEEEEGRLPDWSSRTAMVFDVLQDQLKEQDSVSFIAISKGISRRTAAACFLEILQLKTWGFIDVAQDKPFSDITINPTTKFWDKGTELAKM